MYEESLTARLTRFIAKHGLLLQDLGQAQIESDIESVRRDLERPLRVAVAGGVSAGKSTLVNALLGSPIAPTGATETTQVVARFTFGDLERADAVLRESQQRRRILLENGRLPHHLPDAEHIEILDVKLSSANGILDRMTLIDTPGIGSLNREMSAATKHLLGVEHVASDQGANALMAAVDALVFVFTEALKKEEVKVVRQFAHSNPGASSAACAIGVLSQADRIDDPNPMAKATELAQQHLEQCAGALSAVVPVMGKLAETTEAAPLTEDEVAQLNALAEAPDSVRSRVLRNAHFFLDDPESPVRPDIRLRLLERLDMFGLATVIGYLAAAPRQHRGAAAVNDLLAEESGFSTLRDRLLRDFGQRADAIKARHALTRIERISKQRAAGETAAVLKALRERIDEIKRERWYLQLRLVEMLAEVDAGRVTDFGLITVPEELGADLARMAAGGSVYARLGAPDAEREAAEVAIKNGRRRWGALQLSGTLDQRNIADAMIAAYAFARNELTDPGTYQREER